MFELRKPGRYGTMPVWGRHRRRRVLRHLAALALTGLVGAIAVAGWSVARSGGHDRVLIRRAGMIEDLDCSDFGSRWEAQRFHSFDRRSRGHGLDRDGDGLVCEHLPWFSWR